MNTIRISGIISNIEVAYDTEIETFYSAIIECKRKSGTVDRLPVIISEVFLPQITEGQRVGIIGEIRTRNANRLLVNIFAKDIFEPDAEDENTVKIEAFICKKPIYRKTLSDREISDFIAASNRSFNKTDYIPCIAWGRTAKKLTYLSVGTMLDVYGRMQSREYTKRYEDGTEEIKTVYEVSAKYTMERRDCDEVENKINSNSEL